MTTRTAPKIGETVHKAGEINAGDAGSRTRRFVISDETVDRMGDVIVAKGWNFTNFLKNPVLLWGHQSRELPIGRVDKISTDGTKTIADVTFASADERPFAESVLRLIDGGFINASSVGFNPLAPPEPMLDNGGKWTGGLKFNSQELLELSIVSVPAHPDALIVKALGVPDADIRRVFVEPTPPGAFALAAREREIEILNLKGFGP